MSFNAEVSSSRLKFASGQLVASALFKDIYDYYYRQYPTPVALGSKAQVCRVSIVGITGSIPFEGMDVRPLLIYCSNAEVAFCGPHIYNRWEQLFV